MEKKNYENAAVFMHNDKLYIVNDEGDDRVIVNVYLPKDKQVNPEIIKTATNEKKSHYIIVPNDKLIWQTSKKSGREYAVIDDTFEGLI